MTIFTGAATSPAGGNRCVHGAPLGEDTWPAPAFLRALPPTPVSFADLALGAMALLMCLENAPSETNTDTCEATWKAEHSGVGTLCQRSREGGSHWGLARSGSEAPSSISPQPLQSSPAFQGALPA